jgi:oxaloacetate decarboxylase gamma subunit
MLSIDVVCRNALCLSEIAYNRLLVFLQRTNKMEGEIFDQGLTLMLVGMGTVFTFLTVLVMAMSAMSLLIRRLTPEVDDIGQTDEEVVAITAAIAKYRQQ